MSDYPVVENTFGKVGDLEQLFCHLLPTKPKPYLGKILVTGASGYIGGRLVPELLARGYSVRVMVRGDLHMYQELWSDVEIVEADALDEESLKKALEGITIAYYLIHSLLLGPREFEKADIQAARNFRKAAHENGIKRIIYLGSMDYQSLQSSHLKSRIEVAQELTAGSVPVTTLRAAIIIGSGSASYELVHNLVKILRLIPIPHWARNRCQPISVRDVIKYLVGVLESPETSGKSFDIGGKEILTYELMLKQFATILGKKIIFTPSPISNIGIYSFLAGLLTPVPTQITVCLMEGLKDEVVCRNNEIKNHVPFTPLSYKESIVRALNREDQDKVYTRWSDAYPPAHELAIKLNELSDRPVYTATYSLLSERGHLDLFNSICRIGGKIGWFHNNWMWRVRGIIDKIFFGVGSARGRKTYSSLQVNDVIDFWRVEKMKLGYQLLLRSEMKMPGKAWLEFLIHDEDKNHRLTITAYFDTKTFFGKVYWYFFMPFHHFIFKGLIKQIEKRS